MTSRHAIAHIGDDVKLHLLTEGDGPRIVVLLHGFPQTSHEWRKVTPLLVERGFGVITPDYRGAGGSSKPAGGYDKWTMAGDIKLLLHEHLAVQRPIVLVGHDIGAMVALAFAFRFREFVSHLVLIDAPLQGTSFMTEMRGDPRGWHVAFHQARDIAEHLVHGRERGYARVSKGDEQSNKAQARALSEADCKRVFEEKASGGRWDRPELHRMLDQLRDGDTVVVWKLDRLSRSLKDVLHLMDKITSAGAGFRSLAEAIDTTTAAGRMMMQMVGSFAEYERAMIRERTTTGLAQARAEGRIGGRRKKLDPKKRREIAESVLSGRKSGAEMARLYDVSEPTVSRIVAEHRRTWRPSMPTSHDLKGLMKFLARDEWRECFEEVFEDHFGPVLDAGDMEFENIAEFLGDNWAMTLWGCAFEDFLTQDFEVEGGNIIDEYLKRRGWKENAQAKAYMKALRTSVMSLYEVSEIVPGKSLVARDVIRGGESLAVSEGTATKTLKQWDRIAARIVPVMGRNVFAGGLLPFTPQATDALFDGLRQMFGKKNAKKLPVIRDEDLRAAASMFTLSWLFVTLEQTMDMPPIQNADGDDLVFHDVRFPLRSGTTQKDITARMNAIPGMSQENAKFWNWLEGKRKSKAKKNTGVSLDTTMENGLRVLGNVELKGRFLHLAANSAARADKGMVLIQQTLGDLVRPPLTEIRTVEQMMVERPAQDQKEATSDIPPEIAEQIVHQFMDRQYRETLDQPVGMLGNKTPRQAAKSAAGRQKVAEWLKYLENQSAKQPNAADPMATYSFEWMWHELDVSDLRQ